MNWKGWTGSVKRRQGGRGAGPGGTCVCVNPSCKYQMGHKAGIPCYQVKCPKCSSPMVRKDAR